MPPFLEHRLPLQQTALLYVEQRFHTHAALPPPLLVLPHLGSELQRGELCPWLLIRLKSQTQIQPCG